MIKQKCALNYSIFHPKTIYFLLAIRKIHELREAKTLAIKEVDGVKSRKEKRKIITHRTLYVNQIPKHRKWNGND